MQVKTMPPNSGDVHLRTNRGLIRANRKAVKDGLVSAKAAKELVESASKITVTRKETVKPAPVHHQESVPNSPPPEEAAKQFNICYLEQQAKSQPGANSVSCFRTTGAVPIPRRASTVVNPNPPPPPPRKISMPEPLLPRLSMATLTTVEPVLEERLVNLVENVETFAATVTKAAASPAVEAAAVCDQPEVAEAPKPKPKEPEFHCEKHSKCHCHLFAIKVDGFYQITN